MRMVDIIREKLTEELSPTELEVLDESAQHRGHASAPEGGESHFKVVITAECFRNQSRVNSHRLVNAALATELQGKIHALAITAKAPD